MFGFFNNTVMAGVRVKRDRNLIPDKVWKKIRNGKYERGEREAALKIAKKGDVVLELGSGIGLTAAALIKNSQISKIIAYEANPALIPFAHQLLQTNGIENIELRNAVLSHSNAKELQFYLRNPYWSSSLSAQPENYTDKIIVAVENANASIREFKPDIIVSDIEGGEIEFFTPELDLSHVRAVVIEKHPKKTGIEPVNAMMKTLAQKGFIHTLETVKPNVIAVMREKI